MNLRSPSDSRSSPGPNTLVDLLQARAMRDPAHLAYRFIQDDQSGAVELTYAELDRRARAIGAWLESLQARGERALLLYPPGLDYIAAFFGCLYAGVTAVPAYPPRLNRPAPRIQAIAADSQAAFALTTSTILRNLEQRFEHAPDLQALRWLDSEQVPAGLEAGWRRPDISADTLAFLQYTSGSTSRPKGVMLSHSNLVHNLKAIRHGFGIGENAEGVFWLPSYHDMGLIGGILEPLYVKEPSTLMSPVSFLQRPVRWLEAISRYKGTISGAPNFAYDLCAEKITPEQIEKLDLRSWSLAFCGAEPVRPETLERFARTFAPCGFREEAFYPCFGMAESTLIVSGGQGPAKPRTITVDRKALERDRVRRIAGGEAAAMRIVSCGQAILDQQILIVDPSTLQKCPSDQVGEVWVSGPSVARGYWGLEDETRQTFQAYLADGGEGPFLRTGDLGFLHDGQLYITGRLKDLIIIHGSNHYPQDIELTVESAHAALQPGAGAAFSVTEEGREQLVIVQEVNRQNRRPDIDEVAAAVRGAVAETHDLQVHAIVLVKPMSIPKTSSGKIQRRACRNAFLEDALEVVAAWRRASSSPVPPRSHEDGNAPPPPGEMPGVRASEIRDWLIARIAAMLEIDPGEIDPRQPFTYYGLGSIQAVSLTGDLEVFLNRTLSPTLAWDYPTIELLANYLAGEPGPPKQKKVPTAQVQPTAGYAREPVAIIGLGCRFPGAPNPAAFWDLLRDGVDAISEVPPERWNAQDFYSAEPGVAGKVSSRWGGFLEQVDRFDPHFFGISPREAARMDPQQRLLLEVSWEALENAFIPPASLAGSQTGVFVGISSYDYAHLGFGDPQRIDAYSGTGNAHSIAANRLSYLFDLRGPSMAVDTACSSSLVATHLACQSLRTGESDLALAAGVNLILTPELTITFSQARMLSPDGHCKTFDAAADGYVRGEGCGVVVLKRLADALRDGDPILALIRGSAVNQDGRSNGLTAPNGLAQQDVIRRALADAGVAPGQIGYVEAHGTGTPLGDPIEISSLQAVLDGAGDEKANGRVLVGSVKTNIGHLESAAGIAGLIKSVLALQNEAIPPHLHLKEINPYLSLEDSRLEIGTYLRPWKRRDHPRFAGVSSFGFGGSNAHIVLSEAPPFAHLAGSPQPLERPRHILALSAKSQASLLNLASRVLDSLETARHPLQDIAFSANTTRSHFEHRLSVQAGSVEELIAALDGVLAGDVYRPGPGRQPRIAFLFTGQGSQYPGMGKQFYETQPVFRAALDRCARILDSILDRPLLEILFPAGSDASIHQTGYTQPALFAFEYALAETWRAWGIEPAALLGHSVGEYVAACLAGVFSLEDGLGLIAERGRLMGALPRDGSMAAVFAGPSQVAEALNPYQDRVSIAASNSPENTVISGETTGVQAVLDELAKQGIVSKRLAVSHAFHSPLMDSILEDFYAAARKIRYDHPRIPLVSNLTGAALGPDRFPEAAYWRDHIRAEVKFSQGIQSLAALGVDAFLEVGPGPVLSGLGKRCLPDSPAIWLPSFRQGMDEWEVILESLGNLYVCGAEVDWAGFDEGYERRKVALPNYPFERQRYWLGPSPLGQNADEHRGHGASDPRGEEEPHIPSKNGKHARVERADPPEGRRTSKYVTLSENEGDRGIFIFQATRSQRPGPSAMRHAPQDDPTGLDAETLLGLQPDQRQAMLAGTIQQQAARVLGMDPSRLDLSQPLDTLGLDSLMAMELKSSLESRLGLSISIASLLQGPTVSGLAKEVLDALDSTAPESLLPITIHQGPSTESPLSYGQQALWFLHQLLPEDISFNVAGAVRIRGELDGSALESAFRELVARHESLRSTFHVVDGEPVQRIHKSMDGVFQVKDASKLSQGELRERLAHEAHRPFDLERGPALRAILFEREEKGEHVLLLSMDHIITDFWSMTVLARELLAAYTAIEAGKEISLPPLPVHYADYVRWQAEILESPQGEKQWAYWRDELSGEPPALNLPTDRPRAPFQTYRGDSQHLFMDGRFTEQLKSLAREHGATLFMTLLASFQVLLHRYSNQKTFLVGTVAAGRSQAPLAGLVGYFINPLALRADFSGDPSFSEVLQRVRRTTLGAFEHQDYPPALLAKRLGIRRDSSRPPLFETMFILQKAQDAQVQALSPFALGIDGARMQVGRLSLESVALGGEPAQFDLTLMVAESGGGLAAAMQYNADLFDPPTIRRMLEHFRSLLQSIVANPSESVAKYSLVGEAERKQTLLDWNQTYTAYPRALCIPDLVQDQVNHTPDAIAVRFEDQALTYRELNERADQLVDVLAAQGVRPGTLVGLFLHRSLEMLVGLLGVLKAGGAYLPLDPSFPSERLAFMLEDSKAPVILTQTSLMSELPEHRARQVCLDAPGGISAAGENAPPRGGSAGRPAAKPGDLAYIIYTSGSTGKPKGVQIHHGAVVNFLLSMRDHLGITADDALLAVTTLSFDIAVLELLLPLTVGAQVVIAGSETAADGALLAKALDETKATFMQATPASWRSLLEAGWEGNPELKILCGGEALTVDLAERLLDRGAQSWNLYGPTETTIWSTMYRVCAPLQPGISNTVPIGKPIANTRVYILDANLQPVPTGVIGDLHIGGEGVSRGYLDRPDLTAERFIPNPFEPGEIIYKTGDLARYLPDGNLEFFGRGDQQVKVRGFRIEAGEVETALAAHPAVRRAVVTAWKERSSDASLVAYVVPQPDSAPPASQPPQQQAGDEGPSKSNGAIDPASLRAFLRTKLPEYMVPSIFIRLDSLPLTPNGKVDRKALPPPSPARPDLHAPFVAPRTPLELELAELCAQVLGLESRSGEPVVGLDDNFFDLGGHSLLGTRLVFLLREKYGLEAADLPLRALFEQPTVRNLARTIELVRKGERRTVELGRSDFIRRGQLSLDELNAEAQLDPEITAGDLMYEEGRAPEHILLTGATGFVGAFLLHDLLRSTSARIHCLLRADDPEKGLLRLKNNLEAYRLWDDSFERRIAAVPGDLGEPRLGLGSEGFEQLASAIDVIYHNGAMVNFVYPYRAHKASNVLGTQEVLRLAGRTKLKPVHFVSTLSILYAGGVNDGRILCEDADLDGVGAPFGGYAQSKWVAEKLVMQAGARGIPYAIYRPGLVSGHSVSGAWNTDNLISSMTRACVLLGSIPDLDVTVNIVPVDFVSAAIVRLSQDPENLGQIYHLDNPEPVHFSRLGDWLASQGLQTRVVSFDEWRAELFRQVPNMPSGSWEPYLPLLEEVEEQQVFMPEFDLSNTLARLQGSGIRCHPVNDELFSAYLNYFLPRGFQKKPEPKAM